MEALDLLNSKIDTLLKKHAALEAENHRLKETIAGHDKTVDDLRKKIASLENGMVSVHIGKTVDDDDEKANMRAQLDTVILEIDKILNTLND
jgi:cell division septum initiation protein DivIVA